MSEKHAFCSSVGTEEKGTAWIRFVDAGSARRQFRLSLVLLAAMAFAAFILGWFLPTVHIPEASRPVAAEVG